MGIWTTIFSGGGIASKGLEIVDEAFHTDQEKGALKLTLLKLYEPYKVIQRLLALTVTIAFVGLHVVYSLVDIVVVLNGGERLMAGLAEDNINTLGEGWSWIMIWYFSGGLVEGGVSAIGKAVKANRK